MLLSIHSSLFLSLLYGCGNTALCGPRISYILAEFSEQPKIDNAA
jgi:hypothetical protein